MINRYTLAAMAAGIVALAGCSQPQDAGATGNPKSDTASAKDPQSDAEKFGYAIGVDLGNSLKPIAGEVDLQALQQGLEETMAGKPPRMDDAAREAIKNAVARQMQEKQMAERTANAEAAKTKGAEFLKKNAGKEGVKTTESGLQYEVLTAAKDGKSPSAEDKVTVHYRGTLLDDTEFDSSYGRGQPVTFQLNRVIAGWTEGVQLMKTGEKFKFYIPSELAYGERGAGGKIGPNETLIFEVELLEIEAAEKADK